jgi:hypothetical protein
MQNPEISIALLYMLYTSSDNYAVQELEALLMELLTSGTVLTFCSTVQQNRIYHHRIHSYD